MRLLALAVLMLVVACSTGTSPAHPPPPSAAVPAKAETRPGGCGAAPLLKGAQLPPWATINAPRDVPYVIATPALAVGYVFTFPLKADPGSNKVLWYVGTPRNGYPLQAEGHPLRATTPTVTFTKAADSSPGEIYPSGPAVPSSGCWHFNLNWGGGAQHAEVDLLFT